MSYILEALRRAETERERKRRVPGLHAQPVPVMPAEEPGRRRSKAWLWVVLGVGAGVLLPLLWRGGTLDPPGEDAAGTRTAVAGSVTTHSAAAAAEAPPAAAPVAAAAPPPATLPAPPAAPAPHERPATPTAPKTAGTTKAGATAVPEAAPRSPHDAATPATAPSLGTATSRAAPPAPALAPVAAAASAPEPRLRSLAELPDELRRGVPQLAFGGSVYSEIATQRMVIFNGQVLREGDAVTDDLQLEQIRPRSAVMRIRGQRFEVGF